MSDFRLSDAFGRGATGLLFAAALLVPGVASAAIFNSPTPAASASSLTFKTAAGSVAGRWAYRSIAISGDPKALMTKLALGSSEFDLTEEGGKITGTRPGAAKGETYPVTGFVVYGPRKAPQIVLHSTSVVNGKTFEYDYFGYLMPSWTVGGAQADTIMGTVARTDPQAPEAAAIVVSFIATRESADAPKPAAASKPAPVKPKPKPKPAAADPAAAPAAAPAAPAASN